MTAAHVDDAQHARAAVARASGRAHEREPRLLVSGRIFTSSPQAARTAATSVGPFRPAGSRRWPRRARPRPELDARCAAAAHHLERPPPIFAARDRPVISRPRREPGERAAPDGPPQSCPAHIRDQQPRRVRADVDAGAAHAAGHYRSRLPEPGAAPGVSGRMPRVPPVGVRSPVLEPLRPRARSAG